MPGETKQQRRRKQNKSITVTSVGSKDTTQKQESSKINDIQISIASFFFKFIHLGLSLQVLSWGVPKTQFQSTKRETKKLGKGRGKQEGWKSYCHWIMPIKLSEVDSETERWWRGEVNGPLHFMPVKFIWKLEWKWKRFAVCV